MFNRLLKKDKNRRKLFNKNELKKKVLKILLIRTKNPKYQIKINKFSHNASITRIKNRCLVTGTCKSILSKFKLSRWELKKKLVSGKVVGYRKSSW